jgi:hypothetical protein
MTATPERDDASLIKQMALEIARKGPHAMELVLRPESVLQLVALVQLAQRHPTLPATHHAFADRVLTAAREYFAECPGVLEAIRRGDDPAEDR